MPQIVNKPSKPKNTGFFGNKRRALSAVAAYGVGNAAEYAAYHGLQKLKVPEPVAWFGADAAKVAGSLGTYMFSMRKKKKIGQTGLAGGGGRRR